MEFLLAIFNYLIIVFIIMCLFISVIYEKRMKLSTKYFIMIITLICLSILATFRSIGTDTSSYELIFNREDHFNLNLLGGIFQTQFEPGFLMIISILKELNLDFEVLLFIFFILPMIITFYILMRLENKKILLTYLVFLLFYLLKGPLDIIRHFLAAVIYLSAIYSFYKSRFLLSYIKIIFAVFFHYSSLIALPILMGLVKLKWTKRSYILILLTTVLIGLISKEMILNSVNIFGIDKMNVLMYKVQGYIDVNFLSNNLILNIVLQTTLYMPLTLNILISVWYFSILKESKKDFSELIHKTLIIGTIISSFVMSIGATVAGYRMDFFLGIGNFILVANIISFYSGKKKMFACLFFISCLVIQNLLTIIYFLR